MYPYVGGNRSVADIKAFYNFNNVDDKMKIANMDGEANATTNDRAINDIITGDWQNDKWNEHGKVLLKKARRGVKTPALFDKNI